TGTKRIGEGGRANRSMMFARELERLAVPTVYAYVPSEDDVGVQPDEGCLLQVPIDQFDRIAARLASEVDARRRLLIGSMPDGNYCRLVGLFRHRDWRVIYEARDDWSEFAAVGAAKWYAEIFERFAVSQAEKVFCVSPPLVRSMGRFTDDPAKVLLSPNGTTEDFISFGKAARSQRRGGGGREIAAGRPIVGYFGHLTEQWFDWDALRGAARELPEVDFEIIGFDMPALSLPDNITYLGSMTHEQIRGVATEWAVAMIPFRHGKLSRAVDPIKIYEYLSLGLKVVACPMGMIESYPLTFCYGEFELVDAIRQALAYVPTARDYEAIDALLAGASWKARLLEMLAKSGIHLDEPAAARAL
ncbi:MAG: glycosyltransferase, partial [Alphaproteobacteria bacterium]